MDLLHSFTSQYNIVYQLQYEIKPVVYKHMQKVNKFYTIILVSKDLTEHITN